jgi:hypothetical protein
MKKKRFHRHLEFSRHFDLLSLETFFFGSKSLRKCIYIFIKD